MQSEDSIPSPSDNGQFARPVIVDAKQLVEMLAVVPLLVGAQQLSHLLSVSQASIYRLLSAGKLPRPITLSGGTVRWRRETIEQWLVVAEQLGRLPDRDEMEAFEN